MDISHMAVSTNVCFYGSEQGPEKLYMAILPY
jgi:hypothetical protein